jgi:hypothetical protein
MGIANNLDLPATSSVELKQKQEADHFLLPSFHISKQATLRIRLSVNTDLLDLF